MRHHVRIVLIALGLAACWLPAQAQSRGRVSVGAILWRHGTNLSVERATDFDGSNITTRERAKDWDVLGSGVGARISYELPRVLTLYGEVGTAQATVRDKDVADPNQDVASRGLNDGAYLAVGARLGGDFGGRGDFFWSMGGALSAVSTALEQDINTSWDYDETKVTVDGKVGTWVQRAGFYGGLRLVRSHADLHETDRTNLPGEQTRTTELGRDEAAELLVGAQTRGQDIVGFTELGMVGTFSATAGLTLRF